MYKCKGVGCEKFFESKIGRGLHHKKCKYYEEPKIDESNFNFICECGKKFEKKTQLKGHIAKCKTHLKFVKDIKEKITPEILYEMYVDKKMSALKIAKTLNYPYIGAGQIIGLLKDLNIKTRTSKEAANSKITRELYKQTCLEKYGDINALGKNSPIYKKRNETVKEKYGVDNVFAANTVKNTIKKTMIDRYGVENPIHMPGRKFNNGNRSKIHIKVEELLDELKIKYKSEDTRNLFEKDGYSPRPDIIIDDLKVVIEINGDYWHGNPEKYKANDLICKWGGNVLVKDIWEKDKQRKEQIESFGYNVITLWESFINKELTKNTLWKLLKLNQSKN